MCKVAQRPISKPGEEPSSDSETSSARGRRISWYLQRKAIPIHAIPPHPARLDHPAMDGWEGPGHVSGRFRGLVDDASRATKGHKASILKYQLYGELKTRKGSRSYSNVHPRPGAGGSWGRLHQQLKVMVPPESRRTRALRNPAASHECERGGKPRRIFGSIRNHPKLQRSWYPLKAIGPTVIFAQPGGNPR